jgi:hypothetical protein
VGQVSNASYNLAVSLTFLATTSSPEAPAPLLVRITRLQGVQGSLRHRPALAALHLTAQGPSCGPQLAGRLPRMPQLLLVMLTRALPLRWGAGPMALLLWLEWVT